MKILISISDIKYLLWQVIVQQANFSKFGYDVDTIYVVASNEVSPELDRIMKHPDIKAKFYVYSDTRERKNYLTSIRQHTFAKLFREFPELEKEPIFYVDADILFTRKIDFEPMLADDAWHCSNSNSYVGVDYLKSKGGALLFAQMCDVVGFNSKMIQDIPAGGAQYIMKGVTADYWEKCYHDAENLYRLLRGSVLVQNKPNLVNSWCADMWVTLWNSIYLVREVKIEKELEFSWATDPVNRWDECAIFHNAGSVKGKNGYFNKFDFNKESPFGKTIEVANTNCTYKYVEAIREAEKQFKDILF